MRPKPLVGIVLAVLVFVGSAAYLVRGIGVGRGGYDRPQFDIDEAHKLGEAYYYHLFFERRDTGHPDWSRDFYARTNPPVGKYVFGAALAASGHPVRDQQCQEDFERLWESRDQLREHIPDDMLRVTRRTSAVFGALICTLLFVIGRRVGGAAVGLIAMALLLAHTPFRRHAQSGLTDTILMFHLTLIVPVSLWSARVLRRYWQGRAGGGAFRQWCVIVPVTILLPGLVIALAAGSKLNGALTGPAYAAGLIWAALLPARAGSSWRRLGLALLLVGAAGVVAAALFVSINPYFYHDPIGRAIGTVHVFRDWMIRQQIYPGGGLFALRDKITALGFSSLCSPLLPLSRYLGTLGTWLTVLGFAVGVVSFVGRCLVRPQAGEDPAGPEAATSDVRADAGVVFCWVGICVAAITLWLPMSWERYLLPPYVAICLTTAIGLGALSRAMRSIFEALAGRSPGGRRLRIAAGAASAVAIWIVLAFTPWVIAPTDRLFSEAWEDLNAIDARFDSPQLRRRLGLRFMDHGLGRLAAEQFEAALALLEGNPTDRPAVAVQRCCLLYDLARVRRTVHDRAGALEALRRHIAILEALRDGMTSNDPVVRSGFDRDIAEKRQWLDDVMHKQPDR